MKLTGPILRELISYDPSTGRFVWLKRSRQWFTSDRSCAIWNAKWAGKVAGSPVNGYVRIGVLGADYYAHRLAWLFMRDEWPLEIDHDNRDGTDNRWDNLVNSDRYLNNQNKGLMANNTSGYTGVTRSLNRWQAKITRNGVETYLGTFETPEEAGAAYQTAKENVG